MCITVAHFTVGSMSQGTCSTLSALAAGGLFGIAYPRQPLFALFFVVLFAAIGLEFAQLLTPDRHARAIDAAVKAGSGALGVGAGVWIAHWRASRPWKR